MKTTVAVLLAAFGLVLHAGAQSPSPAAAATSPAAPAGAAPARTDLYHVHFAKAARGKAAELGETLRQQDPAAPMKGHLVLFRHQHGDSWDYCTIEHLGTKMTIEANRPAPPASQVAQGEWHTDTICNGPSWAVFAKELGLDDAAKSTGSGYILSTYRPEPGQREALEKMLSEAPDRTTDLSSGNVLLQHLEGAAWTFFSVTRYNSWADLAKDDTNNIPKTAKADSAWSKVRTMVSFHTDTLCDRVAP